MKPRTTYPRNRDEAGKMLDELRPTQRREIEALERCWSSMASLASKLDNYNRRCRKFAELKAGLQELGVELSTQQRLQGEGDLEIDTAEEARRLLGEDAPEGALAFFAGQVDDRVLFLFGARNQPETVIPFLYAFVHVLLGNEVPNRRLYALANVAFGSVDVPSSGLTEKQWQNLLENWEKRLVGDRRSGREFLVKDVTRMIRRHFEEFRRRVAAVNSRNVT